MGPCVGLATLPEKSLFTRRRKEAYEALHGSAKENRAKAAAEARWGASEDNEGDEYASGQLGHKHELRFDEDQSVKTGESAKSIRRNAERGENIAEDVLEMIAGTHLDSGTYQDSIKNLTHIEQRAKVRAELLEIDENLARAELTPRRQGGR